MEVELTSTATAPIAQVELGVFLGATLREIEATRPSALPTARPRELEGGGIAFRAEAATLIAPGATRSVQVEKAAVPLDRDLSTVTAVIAGCRTVQSVGDATLVDPGGGEATLPAPAIGAGVLAAIAVAVLFFRRRR